MRFLRIRVNINALWKKITSLRNKGIPPSPQVFRNLFNNVLIKIKILSQTKTNYIWRPSVKRDYTNSFEWHCQPLWINTSQEAFSSLLWQLGKIELLDGELWCKNTSQYDTPKIIQIQMMFLIPLFWCISFFLSLNTNRVHK